MKKRRFLAGAVALSLTFVPLTTWAQASSPSNSLVINGNPLLVQVQPVVEQGETFVPVRAAAEAWGANVSYVESEQRVSVDKDGLSLSFVIGKSDGLYNGKPIQMTPARLIQDRALIASDLLDHLLNWRTEWQNEALHITTEQTTLLKTYHTSLSGADHQQEIRHYVTQSPNGMPLYWTVLMDGQEMVRSGNEEGFYGNSHLEVADVDHDGKTEILLYRNSTGSAGAQGLTILKPGEGKWSQLLSVGGDKQMGTQRFQMRYLGEYKVSFKDTVGGLDAIIGLEKDAYYSGMEDMLTRISTWVDPISEYKLMDLDGDGVNEVVSTQRVIGISHADTIATWQTTYKLTGCSYQPVREELVDIHGKVLARVQVNE
ncbi:MAG: stalk domain-containing protein [Bacillota bacterium]